MISSVNHVSFTVSNLNQSITFYRDVLGMECISMAERDKEFSSAVTGIDGVEMNIAYMQAPGFAVELIQYVSGEGTKIDTSTNNPGSAHLCFNIGDYDEWMKRMEECNVKMCGKLCHVPAGPNEGKRVCYMLDNDGNHLEFIEASKQE
ncbi:MAG: hypothetical protein HFI29_12100 [Lachnospiraceae bacterium]|jgi:catechol 2,3-dioxygenase-like lactoylglutathione lyase family enzyme|nr:hypothetical protein [Lachnospiraceae bacterium]